MKFANETSNPDTSSLFYVRSNQIEAYGISSNTFSRDSSFAATLVIPSAISSKL